MLGHPVPQGTYFLVAGQHFLGEQRRPRTCRIFTESWHTFLSAVVQRPARVKGGKQTHQLWMGGVARSQCKGHGCGEGKVGPYL